MPPFTIIIPDIRRQGRETNGNYTRITISRANIRRGTGLSCARWIWLCGYNCKILCGAESVYSRPHTHHDIAIRPGTGWRNSLSSNHQTTRCSLASRRARVRNARRWRSCSPASLISSQVEGRGARNHRPSPGTARATGRCASV